MKAHVYKEIDAWIIDLRPHSPAVDRWAATNWQDAVKQVPWFVKNAFRQLEYARTHDSPEIASVRDLEGTTRRFEMTVPAAYNWLTNGALIADVAKLGYLDGTVLDATYGRGRFWTHYRPTTLVTSDLRQLPGVNHPGVDFRLLPFERASFDVEVLDPPYRLNGTPDLGDFDDAYGINEPQRWQDKHDMIRAGITEAARVVKPGGYLLLKCQDQVCSGAVRWQTLEFTAHALQHGFNLVDRFDMFATVVRKQPDGRRQMHAHGHPSALLVFKRKRSDT